MYKIAKQFDFCYAHRIWNQKLDGNLSSNACCSCRYIHGHQGAIIIHLQAESLKEGMVTDLHHLTWFKKWLDSNLDHKLILDINDPILNYEPIPLRDLEMETKNQGHKVILSPHYFPSVLRERYEGMVFVDFVPTSENFCKWIFDIVDKRMKTIGIDVCEVQFFETPKSQASYRI